MKKLWIIGLLLISAQVAKAQQKEPPYGMDPLSAYSIYYENYKNEDWQMALDYGRWMLYARPESIKGYAKFNLERQFERMITIYSKIAESKQDPTVHTAYLDSALMVYDITFDTFKKDKIDVFDWHLRKGRFYQEHSDYLENPMSKAYDEYMKAYDINAERFVKASDGYYAQITAQNLVSDGKKDKALAFMKEAEQYANQKTKDFFDQLRGNLFSSPKERIAFLKGQLKDDPSNEKVMSELLDLYEKQEMRTEAKDMANKLYKQNPNYDNTMKLADMALANAEYGTAVKYLKGAVDKTKDKDHLAEIYLDLSDANLNLDNLQAARNYARQAAKYDPGSGKPYLKIAAIYAQTVNNCTDGRKMTRQDKVVYWLVLDYLDKAKSVDPSVSQTVSNQYKAYKPVTPTTEEKFFSNWETGQKIKINGKLGDCYSWINETTTVR